MKFIALYRERDKGPLMHATVLAPDKKSVIQSLKEEGFSGKKVFTDEEIERILTDPLYRKEIHRTDAIHYVQTRIRFERERAKARKRA